MFFYFLYAVFYNLIGFSRCASMNGTKYNLCQLEKVQVKATLCRDGVSIWFFIIVVIIFFYVCAKRKKICSWSV